MAHPLVFTDSLARRQLAPPRAPSAGELSFYACGITPYSPAHIGHARSYVVFDLMRSVLEAHGHTVALVRNITDIDDKILAAAQEQGVHWQTLALGHAARNRAQMAQLGVIDFEEPLASEHMDEIIALTARLMDKGHAYLAPTGDVLFEVGSFQGAQLMPHDHEDLLSHTAARVSNEGKRSPLDFVLWKPSKPGEPAWPSPWGLGRPGWHAECSAMVEKRFGATLDYHGGGTDLRFPHHQAEIMQSEAAFGRPLASRWVHHGSVRDGAGRKMSKSLGNYVELTGALDEAEDLLPGAGGAVVRVALLSTLWTKPLDWADGLLAQAADHLVAWARAAGDAKPNPAAGQAVREALMQNLNTPKAYALIHRLSGAARSGNGEAAGGLVNALDLLGISREQRPAAAKARETSMGQVPQSVVALMQQRQALRASRDWAGADRAREALLALGYRVEDRGEQSHLVPAGLK